MGFKHPIDITFITDQLGDSPEIIHEMCSVFIEVLKEYQEKIQEAIFAADFAEIRLQAHKIKPSLSMFGLQELLVAVVELEKVASVDNDLIRIIGLNQKIDAELPLIFHQVSDLMARNSR
jgi:HPt (histidine-containing phosphotransfer) domain-containing protein